LALSYNFFDFFVLDRCDLVKGGNSPLYY